MDDKCQCSLRIRLTGDGCRYCQPQEYIDRLHDNAKYGHAEIERLEARIAELEAALRPFARPMPDWKGFPDDVEVPVAGGTVGDFRRAAAALGENIKPELDDADR
jgi:hypothetical protein